MENKYRYCRLAQGLIPPIFTTNLNIQIAHLSTINLTLRKFDKEKEQLFKKTNNYRHLIAIMTYN